MIARPVKFVIIAVLLSFAALQVHGTAATRSSDSAARIFFQFQQQRAKQRTRCSPDTKSVSRQRARKIGTGRHSDFAAERN